MKRWIETLNGLIPVLEPYPAWVKAVISAWIILTAVAIVGLIFFRTPEATSPREAESSKTTSQASLEELRRKNGVRELQALENDLNLSRLPNGVYGYTVPWIIDSDPTGVVGATGVSRIALLRRSGGTAVMEVHKSSQGMVYIIGFVSQDQLVRLQDPSRKSPLDITLFFSPYQSFDEVVALPVEQIVSSSNRSVESQYVNDIVVS